MEPLQLDFMGFDTRFSPKPGSTPKGKARYIGRCTAKGCKTTKAKDCKCHERTIGAFTSSIADTSQLTETCPVHNTALRWTKIEGTHSDKFVCDPRCTGATGPVCVCSCGGASHGADWL